jgi:hypothetical protein
VVAGEALTSQEPIVASFDAGALRVERLSLEGRAGTITGRGALHAGGALDAELRGQISLSVLAALRPEVEAASGMLDEGDRAGDFGAGSAAPERKQRKRHVAARSRT